MALTLIALSNDDGMAFFLKEKKIYYLKPPYVSSNLIVVSKSFMRKAIEQLNMNEIELSFTSIRNLIQFLKEEYIRSQSKYGIALPDVVESNHRIKKLNEDIIIKIISDIQDDLIVNKKYNEAEDYAVKLLSNEVVNSNKELREKILSIITLSKSKKQKILDKMDSDLHMSKKEKWAILFPNISKKMDIDKVIEYQDRISEKGQLLILNG